MSDSIDTLRSTEPRKDSHWSFPWIKVYTDLIGHPKSIALSRELEAGAETARAEIADGARTAPQKQHKSATKRAWAYVVQLWCWCASHAPTGRIISHHVVAVIEDACGWEGAPGKLFDAMLACRFLEKLKGGALVHDWDEIQGPHLKKAKEDAERKRTARKTARDQRSNGAPTALKRRSDGAGKRESEREIVSSSKEEATAQPLPQGKSKTRQPSEQEKFAQLFEEQRREALNGSYTEDMQLSIQRLNTELQWLHDADVLTVQDAVRLYLQDPKRRQQNPPCSLLWFSRDRAEYLSKAKRGTP
jgi:hypothetical protein